VIDYDAGLHLHHTDTCGDFEAQRVHNAVIVFQRFSQLFTDYVLGASGSITPPSDWRVGLATQAVSTMARNSVLSPTVTGTNVNELGSSTANGYARGTIAKSINTGSVDWGTSTFDNTLSTGGQSTAADQVSIGPFSGAPSPNGADSWFIGEAGTINAGNLHCAGDTAAERTFANGDTEKVTITIKAG
jgi:hypothetical protein